MDKGLNPLLGSFRDPDARIFSTNDRVFRGLRGKSAKFIDKFIETDFCSSRLGNSLVASWKIDRAELRLLGLSKEKITEYDLWIEHEKLPLVTYPSEWSFELFRKAAIFHLDLNVEALEAGFQLKDASSFNVQFIGNSPTFIDLPSFIEYEDGKPWMAYKQFCEMFLSPLLLQSFNGISVQSWLRGSLDGIDILDCSRSLPLRSYLNPSVLAHIHFQAFAGRRISSVTNVGNQKNISIKKENLILLLKSLRKCISGLKNRNTGYWEKYELNTSYAHHLTKEKETIVRDFCANFNGGTIIDVGCNGGQFSEIALAAGVRKVIGIDIDSGALDQALNKVRLIGKSFFPILYDFTNPTPDMGWNLTERQKLTDRLPSCNALICLALIHHLVIAKNIPMSSFVETLNSLAENGLVEFVSKEDPMVQGLLANREDIFPDYTLENFIDAMSKLFKVTLIKSENKTRNFLKFERL